MLHDLSLTFSAAFLATFLSALSTLYLKNKELKRKLLEERYYKAYLPFFTDFVKFVISDVFSPKIEYESKLKLINNLNMSICKNICYLEPKTQSELNDLIKLGLHATLQHVNDLNSESLNSDIEKFYNNESNLNSLKTFYNTMLYEHQRICKKMKLPIPNIENFVLKISTSSEVHKYKK